MTKIEAIFGGILMLAIVMAFAFTAFQKGLFKRGAGSVTAVTIAAEKDREPRVFTGDLKTDLCTCYETAFNNGANGFSLQSVEYKSGYASCRASAGVMGGDAWTQGWQLGSERKVAQRSCRLYLNGLKLQ
ncbi:MAG: hypothetical protein ACWA5L_08725 [bacterium]